jgi:4-hydroxyacetophenone monooxygenase
MTKLYGAFKEIADRTEALGRAQARNDGQAILSTPPPGTSLPMQDTTELREAIAAAPGPVLIALAAHLQQDAAILAEYGKHIKDIWQGGPNIPADARTKLDARVLAILTDAKYANAPPITEEFLKQIMSTIVGEPVTDEFVPLLVEQVGFQPLGRFTPQPHSKPPAGFRVAVIGGGLSGIVSGIRLKESGYDYKIFEKQDDVGGVWWSNQYPGVAVDTPNHFYSLSFELNPNWPDVYSKGPVLMEYWRMVADKYRVRENVAFKTEVTTMRWLEAEKKWEIEAIGPGGKTNEKFDAIICASGLFTHPEPPKVPGLENFKGKAMHTAHWDKSVPLAGKNVIQIGTGASGVQAGPVIAREAKHLTVFQRSPPWVRIRTDRDYAAKTPEPFKWALNHIPHLQQWNRFYVYWHASDGIHKVVLVDPEWGDRDNSVNAISEGMRLGMEASIRQKLGNRGDLIEKVIPNYPPMGKRILNDSSWFEMLLRDNVDLVTTPIERIVADGVVDAEGKHHPADVLVLATGFGMTKIMQQFNIIGEGGVTLRDVWGEEEPRSYVGTMVPKFPNLFLINGPNSGATHGAGVNIYSEAQVHYILTCFDRIFERGGKTIQPTQEAHDVYNEKIDSALVNMVWNHRNVTTYYRNSKGRNFVSCPWRIVDHWHMMREPDLTEMEVA